MATPYIIPLITKTTIITRAGDYVTRCGETVNIVSATALQGFNCIGYYADGTLESYHKSGRLFANIESQNDIVH